MKKQFLKAILILGIVGKLTSCSKEQGCTDVESINFSVVSDKDDGSCIYESDVSFYFRENTADALILSGISSLTISVEGSIIGSYATDVFWSGSEPDCDTQGIVKVTKPLGSDKSKTYPYKVTDSKNTILWQGTVNLSANTCHPTELEI